MGDAGKFLVGQRGRTVFEVGPFGFDLTGEFLSAQGIDQNLDARLVHIVAAAMAVIHAQQGVEIGKQMPARQELAHHLPMTGVRPRPPPAKTRKPISPAASLTISK